MSYSYIWDFCNWSQSDISYIWCGIYIYGIYGIWKGAGLDCTKPLKSIAWMGLLIFTLTLDQTLPWDTNWWLCQDYWPLGLLQCVLVTLKYTFLIMSGLPYRWANYNATSLPWNTNFWLAICQDYRINGPIRYYSIDGRFEFNIWMYSEISWFKPIRIAKCLVLRINSLLPYWFQIQVLTIRILAILFK